MKHLALCLCLLALPTLPMAQAAPARAKAMKAAALSPEAQKEAFYDAEEIVGEQASAPLRPTAARDAEALLKMAEKFRDNWDYGNALHHANLVLGRVALAKKDVAGAEKYLLKAAAVPTTPQLKSFGPNMTLAKELLAKGRRDAVLQYFTQTERIWISPNAAKRYHEWRAAITRNKMPNFEGNLTY